jgi:hypothetical protein
MKILPRFFQKRNTLFVALILCILRLCTSLFAQSTFQSGFFLRKSITVVPLSLSSDYRQTFLQSALRSIVSEGDKYDMNRVYLKDLETAQSLFQSSREFMQDSIESKKSIAVISNVIRKSGVLESIIKSAGNIDSINSRFQRMQKRITTSGAQSRKMSQITDKEIYALINGAYVGVPVLNKIVPQENDAGLSAIGGVYWFKLISPKLEEWKGNLPTVEQVKVEYVDSRIARGSADRTDQKSTNEVLMQEATFLFAQELFDFASSIDELKIRATIQSVSEGIRFDVGKREGAYLDQGYKVYESVLGADGKESSTYMGFVRIDNVANNKEKIDALSDAYSIKGGGYDAGMSAVAHDQLIDILIRPSIRTLTIPRTSINIFFQQLLGQAIEKDATNSLNVNLSAMYNLANIIGVNQLFLGADVGIGIANVNVANAVTRLALDPVYTLEASLFFMKKFWLFSGFAASFELNGGLNMMRVSGTFDSRKWSLDYGTLSFGVGGVFGLEYAFSPDFSLGIEAGYRYALPVTTIKYTDVNEKSTTYNQLENLDFWKVSELDRIRLGGLRGGLRISYSIPKF